MSDQHKHMKAGVRLSQAQVDAYNAFFAICATSTDPNVIAGFAVLQKAIDDSEPDSGYTGGDEPPGDQP